MFFVKFVKQTFPFVEYNMLNVNIKYQYIDIYLC